MPCLTGVSKCNSVGRFALNHQATLGLHFPAVISSGLHFLPSWLPAPSSSWPFSASAHCTKSRFLGSSLCLTLLYSHLRPFLGSGALGHKLCPCLGCRHCSPVNAPLGSLSPKLFPRLMGHGLYSPVSVPLRQCWAS